MAASSSLKRQWLVLSMLPRAPQRIDTRTLETRLRALGVFVNRRTLQRDLVELGALFPVVADDRSRPYSWWWGDVREPHASLPPLTANGIPALALRLRVLPTHLAAACALFAGSAEMLPLHGASELRVNAPDTADLRRALLGLADGVEVLAPKRLRQELAERAVRACKVYACARDN